MKLGQGRLQPDLSDWVVPDELDYYQTLFETVFGKAESTFVETVGRESLPHILVGLSTFLDNKSPHDIRVRAANPTNQSSGWNSPYTTLEVTLSDRPFIVDSVLCELNRLGLSCRHMIHPILRVKRDTNGRIIRNQESSEARLEAYQLFLIARVSDQELAGIEARVRGVLEDVKRATDDYHEMRDVMGKISASLLSVAQNHHDPSLSVELRESADFLNWLDDHNFVFLSYQEFKADLGGEDIKLLAQPESALGIRSRNNVHLDEKFVPLCNPPDDMSIRLAPRPVVIVSESKHDSTVHRDIKMDRILIKELDPRSKVVREHYFLGLFTSTALATPVKDVPILRERLKKVWELDGAIPESHDYKQIESILNSIPLEQLFWSSPAELHKEIRTIMSYREDKVVRVMARTVPHQRGLLIIVIMHRDRFSAQVREKIERVLTRTLTPDDLDFQLVLGEDSEQARLHYFASTDVGLSALDLPQLERTLSTLIHDWYDGLAEKLIAAHRLGMGQRLSACFLNGFSDGYKASTSYETAIQDIEQLTSLAEAKDKYRVAILNPSQVSPSEATSSIRIYHEQESLVLSDVLPVLEGVGLRVLLQSSYNVEFYYQCEKRSAVIDVFQVQNRRSRQPLILEQQAKDKLISAIVALLNGELTNQPLNGLVLLAGLGWREVKLLASYQAYLSQISAATSRAHVSETMLAYPESSAFISHYFEAKFLPDQTERLKRMKEVEKAFERSLTAVNSYSSDRTLRALFNLVEATVRTNYYLSKDYLAHKIDSSVVLDMPKPRPLFEIIVVGSRMEGIHLRGGSVARGGLRWSDRPYDYRTEVLGLLKTQMAKNSVIVPVGSKGGFVLKNPPSEREELGRYVREEYKNFIRGLLDLTDNIKEGEIVHPASLVIHDGPDPYLVVAADKGTARFSDIANSVACEYGFWLGDAFASGGSQGYSHKLYGITARGAWECVKRHFSEIGVDVMEEEFSCAAIGDMSGDVFGNGMLYSDKIRLRAAFNHQHIYIDPTPDAARSFLERKRLFALPHSTWEDYDTTLISRGGGVFSRTAKLITLSPEAQTSLGVDRSEMSGQELVSAILRMPVDLLWNGGIGTYVRASHEDDRAIGDSSNDSVRVTACELRARVIGEGGNGGFTQAARIECARLGTRINTDAIDNSAGVDMSDHEVNIKILLQGLVSDGELTPAERDRILLSMAEDVTRAVLANNYWQSLCLSMASRRSREDLHLFKSLLEYLEAQGPLDAGEESLPDTKAMQVLIKSGQGLTRPELAIMLAYAKMDIYQKLIDSEVPDDPLLLHYLHDYFPPNLRNEYQERIQRHSLRREIIATQSTNTMVNLLGITFIHRTVRDTGSTNVQVLKTTLATLEVLNVHDFLIQLTSAQKVPAESFYAALDTLVSSVEGVVNWLLLTGTDLTDLCTFANRYRNQLGQFLSTLPDLLPDQEIEHLTARVNCFEKMGFESELAQTIGAFEYVPDGFCAVEGTRLGGISLAEATNRYYTVGEKLRVGWLREQLREGQPKDKWSSIAIAGLIVDLYQIQSRLSLLDQELEMLPGNPLARYLQVLTEIENESNFCQSTGDVLARMLSQMADSALREARQLDSVVTSTETPVQPKAVIHRRLSAL